MPPQLFVYQLFSDASTDYYPTNMFDLRSLLEKEITVDRAPMRCDHAHRQYRTGVRN